MKIGGEVNLLLLIRAADWLEQNKILIVERASKRIFNIIKSYRKSKMPMEESRETMRSTLRYIIDFLRDKTVSLEHETEYSVSDLIKFEEGIASTRVIYEISLEDLLHAIRIFRDEIWCLIASNLDNESIPASEFFKLEKRINIFINHMITRIAGSYNKTMAEIISDQASDLQKWEEVVKSASSIELKIPCRGEFVSIVRLQAESLARRLKYSEEEVQDIKVAVGEACDNSIEHGISDKGVDVHYHLSLEELRIEVIDYGRGFDPTGKGEEPPDLFSERGRGIFLMKALMDRAELYSRPGEGTMVELVKKRIFK